MVELVKNEKIVQVRLVVIIFFAQKKGAKETAREKYRRYELKKRW